MLRRCLHHDEPKISVPSEEPMQYSSVITCGPWVYTADLRSNRTGRHAINVIPAGRVSIIVVEIAQNDNGEAFVLLVEGPQPGHLCLGLSLGDSARVKRKCRKMQSNNGNFLTSDFALTFVLRF